MGGLLDHPSPATWLALRAKPTPPPIPLYTFRSLKSQYILPLKGHLLLLHSCFIFWVSKVESHGIGSLLKEETAPHWSLVPTFSRSELERKVLEEI